MSDDETQPVSGSRWEQPADPNTPRGSRLAPPTPSYAPAPPPNRNRGRLLLAGGAVGVALIAGAGGFALGHATAGDDRDAGVGRTGFGPNGGPGQGFPNNGQQPPGFQGGPGGQDGLRPRATTGTTCRTTTPRRAPRTRDLRRRHEAARLRAWTRPDWDERYAASELVWSAEPNRFVAEACADLSPGRALDVAAGEGRNAIWLAQRGWTVTAGDFSQVGLDKGRRLAEHAGVADRVAWLLADATRTEWPDDHDLVVVAYLQLVEAERREAVLRAFAALQPGGRFVWVAHDSSNLTEGTGGPQDPSVLMTAEDVLIDLTGEPFDVIRAERVARPVGDATAYDCLVVLEHD